MDSGGSTHMASSDGILLTRLPPSHPFITIGNGQNLPVSCPGTSQIPTSASNFTLNNVLVVPFLVHNLLSVQQFTRDNNCSIEFDALDFSVKDIPNRHVMLRCIVSATSTLFLLQPHHPPSTQTSPSPPPYGIIASVTPPPQPSTRSGNFRLFLVIK